MPKQVLQLTDFSGGLNAYSDARDIKDEQFAQNWNAAVDTNGVIRVGGMASDSIYADSFTNEHFQKGHGLFQFVVDYGFFGIDSNFNSGVTSGTIDTYTSTTVFVLENKESTSSTNDYYTGMSLFIYSGAGIGQTGRIKKYVGSSRTITLDKAVGTALNDKDDSSPSKYIIYRWATDGINWQGLASTDADKNYITNGMTGGMLEVSNTSNVDDYFIYSKKTPVDNTTGNFGYIEYRPNSSSFTSTGVVSDESTLAATVDNVSPSATLTVDGTAATATALLNKRLYKSDGTFLGICTSINSTTEIVFSGGTHASIANDTELYTDGVTLKAGVEYSLSFNCSMKNRMYNMIANGKTAGIVTTGILVNQSVAAATTSSINITTDATATTALFLNRDIYQKEVDTSFTFIGRCTAVGSSTQITFGGGIAVDLKDNTTLYAAGWGERPPWIEIFSPTVADTQGSIKKITDITPTPSGSWTDGTRYDVVQDSEGSSTKGVDAKFTIITSSNAPTFYMTDRGRGYVAGDTLKFTDAGGVQTATIEVNSINTTGLALYADDEWIEGSHKHFADGTHLGDSISGYLSNGGINYVQNGDFADGTTGWTSSGMTLTEIAGSAGSPPYYDGDDGTLKLQRTADTNYLYQDITLEKNTPYHFNCLYRASNEEGLIFYIQDRTTSGNPYLIVPTWPEDSTTIWLGTQKEFCYIRSDASQGFGSPLVSSNLKNNSMGYYTFTTPDNPTATTVTVRIYFYFSPVMEGDAWLHGVTVFKAHNDLVSIGRGASPNPNLTIPGVEGEQEATSNPFADTITSTLSTNTFSLNFTIPFRYADADDWIIRIHAGHYGNRDSNNIPESTTSDTASNANQEIYIDNIKLVEKQFKDTTGDTLTLLSNNTSQYSGISIHSKTADSWMHNYFKWTGLKSKPVYTYVNGMLKISDANFNNIENNNILFYYNTITNKWEDKELAIPNPPSVKVIDSANFLFSPTKVDLIDYLNNKYEQQVAPGTPTYRKNESEYSTNWPMNGLGPNHHTGMVVRAWHGGGNRHDNSSGGILTEDVYYEAGSFYGSTGAYPMPASFRQQLYTPYPKEGGDWYEKNIDPGNDPNDASGTGLEHADNIELSRLGINPKSRNRTYSTQIGTVTLPDDYEGQYYSAGDTVPDVRNTNEVEPYLWSSQHSQEKVRNPLCMVINADDAFGNIEGLGNFAGIEIEFGYEYHGANNIWEDGKWHRTQAILGIPSQNQVSGTSAEDNEWSGWDVNLESNNKVTRTYGSGFHYVKGRFYNHRTDMEQTGKEHFHTDSDDGECVNIHFSAVNSKSEDTTIAARMQYTFSDLITFSNQLGVEWKGLNKQFCLKLQEDNTDLAGANNQMQTFFDYNFSSLEQWGGNTFNWRWQDFYNEKYAMWTTVRINKLEARFYNEGYNQNAQEEDAIHELGSEDTQVAFTWGEPEESSAGWGQRAFKVGTSSVNIFGEESSIKSSNTILGISTTGEFSIPAGYAPEIVCFISSHIMQNKFLSKTKFYMKDVDSDIWFLQFYVDHKTQKIHSTTSGLSTPLMSGSSFMAHPYKWIISRDNLRDFNEVNSYESETMVSQDDATSNTKLTARYKASVVANNRLYVGNIIQDGELHGDRMLKSPIGKYNLLPKSNFIDVAINDGDEITGLAYYKDKILQFKKQKVFVINVSGDYEFLEDTFENVGVELQTCITTTPHGICWANKKGCYLYNGKKIVNLIDGLIQPTSQYAQITGNYWVPSDSGKIPSIAYIQQNDSILVKFDIALVNEFGQAGGISFHFPTQSWSFHQRAFSGNTGINPCPDVTNMITDVNGDILYYAKDDSIKKWVITPLTTGDIKSFYWTSKDFTFGDISVRKKIYKVYITYKTDDGEDSGVKIEGAVNGSQSFTTGSHPDTVTFNASTSVFAGTSTACYGSSTLNETDGIWKTAELKFSTPSKVNNIYSFQLQISSGNVHTSFEINDISIIYRTKNIK